ncbi:Sodium/proton antiporter NhaA [Luteitalea pratensis]|uniref:Sodium/proton antiporter NhaA n=1 Tax=Luteitalea pratensis TaxID=1855912 RepID=A0A143PMM2_LUTPR|nr:Na+/H+ antiporter NhaA [Luteitalea pratensis]AMY09845.1 Sodium/proton antiporter NhaA [Luteitalea pratensis]
MTDETPRPSGGEPRRRKLRRRVRASVPRLSRFAVEHLLLLPAGVLAALAWVNIEPESYYRFTFAIAFAVNDVAIALFFGLITKEVVEATAPGGVLHPWRRAMLPVVASLGATAVPALVHLRLVDVFDDPMLAAGWPATLATDLAIGYFVARLIFKPHPIVPLFLLLGISSDALGFVALTLFNPTGNPHLTVGALFVGSALAIAAGLRRLRVRSFWPYLIGAGGLSWFGLYWSGLHPALALVPIVPFLPHAKRDPGFFVDAKPDAKDTLSQFEVWWRYPAQVALFFFGLVNAGVPMGALEAGTWALPLAVVFGRPVGLLAGTGLALALGFHLPQRVGWRELIVAGLLAAMGLSVGLFFSAAILPPGQLRSELSMGVLLSLAGAPLAVAAAMLLGVGRFARQAH